MNVSIRVTGGRKQGLILQIFAMGLGAIGWRWLSVDLPDPGALLQRAGNDSTKIYDREVEAHPRASGSARGPAQPSVARSLARTSSRRRDRG
jgi:hypothetical protein